jgi:hypothetical protein
MFEHIFVWTTVTLNTIYILFSSTVLTTTPVKHVKYKCNN